jgi:hypothetical protein
LDFRRLVLFGGISGGAMFNDTYIFDTGEEIRGFLAMSTPLRPTIYRQVLL